MSDTLPQDVVDVLAFYDKSYLEAISDKFKRLSTETGEGSVLPLIDLRCGICNAITDSTLVAELSVYWPEFSGIKGYPVPHLLGAIYAYENLDNLWIGYTGAPRKRLCLWLAEVIDSYLEGSNDE